MSRYGDDTSRLKEKERPPILKPTDWKVPHGSVKAQKDTGDVSPRSKGDVPLSDKQTEEIRRRIEEAKERAKMNSTAEAPSRSASQPAQFSATTQLKSDPQPRPSLSSVSPDLLRELRKIVREEVEQLNKGENTAEPPEAGGTSASSVHSSSAKPWTSAQGPAPVTSSKGVDDKRASSTAAGPSPTATQPKGSPRQSTVRFSDETKPAVPITPRGNVDDSSKKAATSKDSDIELTVVDQTWGTLFDNHGTPTKRMEHVVQGLADYIIEEFIPQGSIVVTPEKMAAFYSYHRLDKEVFPLAVLFKSRPKDLNEALARLYQDLGCQYFLVPSDTRSRPAVPGLTPTGFAHWLIIMIQAYPDEEAKRLDSIVSALPIEAESLLDGKSERLPKQISRYLFPETSVRKSQKLVDEAVRGLMEHVNGTPTTQSKGGGSSSKPTPIIPPQEKRPSTTTGSGPSSRYVPEALSDKHRTEEGGSGHDRDRRTASAAMGTRETRDHDSNRRASIPPPPGLGHLGVAYPPADSSSSNNNNTNNGRGPPSSRRSPATSSSSRKNRSPQRKPHSQSVPSGLGRSDLLSGATDRPRGSSSAALSMVAATVAAAVLGATSSSSLSPSSSSSSPATSAFPSSSPHTGGGGSSASTPSTPASAMANSFSAPSSSDATGSTRGPRAGDGGGGDFVLQRDKKATSLDESTLRGAGPAWNLRDNKVGLEGDGSGRSGKKRGVVVPGMKGPAWDEYLRSPAGKGATSPFMKKKGHVK